MQESRKRLRVSPSLVISIFALVIAMSAGAYAATIAPKNSVVSKSIKNGEVKGKDIAGKAVNSKKIKDGQVLTADIGDGQVSGADIGDGQVGPADLSSAAKADLNDATTLGGLTVAQIVAASGGEYYEAQQEAGTADINVAEASEKTLATLNLPHAGKYLVNTRVPVVCSWNGAGGTDPDSDKGNDLNQPWFYALSKLKQGDTTLQSVNDSCEVEAGDSTVIHIPFPIDIDIQLGTFVGTKTVTMTRLVQVNGPTTLTLTASGAPTGLGAFSSFANAIAGQAMIQAITVQ